MKKNDSDQTTLGLAEPDHKMAIARYSGGLSQDLSAVFLHGFPGIRSKQNRDMADAYAKLNGGCADVLLYPGLTQAPGQFSFVACMNAVRNYFAQIKTQDRIDLIGHSWGGFLALLMSVENPGRIRRLVLLSPLLKFAEESETRSWFETKAADNPAFNLAPAAQLAHEFAAIGQKFPYDKLLKQLPKDLEILFLQANDDEITPRKVAESALSSFPTPPRYEMVKTDHSFFANREAIVKKVFEFLK